MLREESVVIRELRLRLRAFEAQSANPELISCYEAVIASEVEFEKRSIDTP